MKFIRTSIPDIILIKPEVHDDHRGYFLESFRKGQLNTELGFQVDFCQDNETKSKKGVLRGLHFQLPPFAQSKLVRVIEGEVLDASVDIRKGSPTFGKCIIERLSGENKHQLFIPRGFAHGFVVLSDWAVFSYKVDNYYSADFDAGLAFDDPSLGIDWILPPENLLFSEKDKNLPVLKDLANECSKFSYDINLYE